MLNVCDLARKTDAKFGVLGPRRFREHLEEIGIAKVLLKTNRHVVIIIIIVYLLIKHRQDKMQLI